MIKVNPRGRRHEDRAGDPLDGLVNLFDLGIVLSVGFLLAALSSLDLASTLTDGTATPSETSVTVPSDAATGDVPTDGETAIGEGAPVGRVYRLTDGRLVYVVDPSAAPSASPSPPSPTP